MHPIPFPQAYQKPLGAGDNPNTGELPRVVCLDPQTPGVCMSVSCWEPSEEELTAIIRDKRVYISIMASLKHPTQPPCCAIGINPIEAGFYKAVPEEDVKHLAE